MLGRWGSLGRVIVSPVDLRGFGNLGGLCCAFCKHYNVIANKMYDILAVSALFATGEGIFYVGVMSLSPRPMAGVWWVGS